jgi:hypothetical protein
MSWLTLERSQWAPAWLSCSHLPDIYSDNTLFANTGVVIAVLVFLRFSLPQGMGKNPIPGPLVE